MEFKEIVFRQIPNNKKSFQIFNNIRDGRDFSLASIVSWDGNECVDFVPIDFKGDYFIRVGSLVDSIFNKEKASQKLLNTETVFQVSIDPSKKAGSLSVQFDCSMECDAKIIPVNNQYIPKILEQNKEVTILIITAPNDAALQRGKKFSQILNYYNFRASVIEGNSSWSESDWNRELPLTASIVHATKKSNNDHIPIEIQTFLMSAIYYNHLFGDKVPFLGWQYDEEVNYDFVINLPGWN